jgi:hypothetical protein
MFLTQPQIDQNIIWLREHASAPVRCLTHKHLLLTPDGSETLSALWREVESCRDAQEIFSKQKQDGSWCSGGAWADAPSYSIKGRPDGYDPESPKYVTAIWVLPLLGEMGFSAADERVRRGCEYLLNYQSAGFQGHYRIFNEPGYSPNLAEFSPCRYGQWMIALGKAGMAEDERVRRGYAVLAAAQREDGGWANPSHIRERGWTRSCPWSSANAALALYASGLPEYRETLRQVLEFQAWHLSTKPPEEIQRFFYHGHNALIELLMFSELGIGLDTPAVQTQLDWLMGMYCPGEGHFHYTGKPPAKFSNRADAMDARVAKYRLYHLAEDDWLTYYATRIAANLLC